MQRNNITTESFFKRNKVAFIDQRFSANMGSHKTCLIFNAVSFSLNLDPVLPAPTIPTVNSDNDNKYRSARTTSALSTYSATDTALQPGLSES